MKRISAYEIALSALSCAVATIFLVVGVYSEVLLLTSYMLAGVAMMLPLSKGSYWGFGLSYIATCILTLIFCASRFWDILPFIAFFGLHPFINELQLKIKINCWVACGVKALWFDGVAYLIWRFVFLMTTSISFIDEYIIPVILVGGTAVFVLYDFVAYKWRAIVNVLVRRISKK